MVLQVPAFAFVFEVERLDEPAAHEEVKELLEQHTQAITRNPRSAAAYARRGASHFKLRDFERAAADFTKAIELEDLDEAYFGRGMALGRNGFLDEGIADLGVFIERHPKSSLAYTKRGVRYIWKGDFESAERDLREALAIDPNNAEAHDDIGVIYARRSEYERAAEHFRATVRTDPSYQKGHHNLAMVYLLLGRDGEALPVVERALQLQPESRDSLLLKSVILESLGRVKEAKAIRDEAEFLPEGDASARLPIE
jgi:tetratricopeptide (TPR) repeat protein